MLFNGKGLRVGCHLMVEARRHDGWVPFDAMVKAGGLRVKGVMVTG